MLKHIALSRLSAALDGELSVAEATAVAAHLAGCARCARRLEGLRRAAVSLRGLAQPTAGLSAPAALHAGVRVVVAAGRHDRRAGRWAALREAVVGSLFAAAGTAALAAMVAVLYVQPARGFADGGRLRERLAEMERIERFERLLEMEAGAAPGTPAKRPQSSGGR
jgi:anti-sigma factor RsiW